MRPADEPMDLDDKTRLPHRVPHAGDVWGVAKLALIAFALVLLVVAFFVEKPIHAAVLGSLSFFLLGLARLAQVEQHRYPL
jgi:hypothetical protein